MKITRAAVNWFVTGAAGMLIALAFALMTWAVLFQR